MTKTLRLFGIVAVLAATASAADYTWLTVATDNWNVPGRWDQNSNYPGFSAGDTALIDVTGPAYTVTLNVTPGNALDSFRLNSADATLAMNRVLTVDGPADLDVGAVEMNNGGGFAGTGTLTNNVFVQAVGSVGVTAATFDQNGTVTLLAGPSGLPTTFSVSDSFANDGTITLTSADNVRTATLTMPTGTLTNSAGAFVNINEGVGGLRYLSSNLVNDGTVNVSYDVVMNKSGGQYTNNNLFNVSAGDTATVNGTSTLTFTQAGGTLDNQGAFVVAAERFNFDGGNITGNAVELNAGFLNIGAGSTGSGVFDLRQTVTYSGDVAAAQTLNILAGPNGLDATTTAASGFSNSGLITLTSQETARTATLSVPTSTFTNAGGNWSWAGTYQAGGGATNPMGSGTLAAGWAPETVRLQGIWAWDEGPAAVSSLDDVSFEAILPMSCSEALEQEPGYLGDINNDCYVDIGDIAQMAHEWMRCVAPFNPECEKPWETP